ncbi:hypothetical protein CB599_11670 [Salmonella enterica subsp. enterica serovar Adjame]|nr:hypothetical protein [Salmonella enterica subsp. enterica serovar Adjame]
MQLPSEAIRTESEFKAACKTGGFDAIKLLDFIIFELKEQAFSPSIKDNERNIIAKKVLNLDEAINRIKSAPYEIQPITNDY